MIHFTTKSGAVYAVDEDNRRLMRETGPYSPGINYETVPDNAWQDYVRTTSIEIGASVAFLLKNGLFRVTTPVVSVEEQP